METTRISSKVVTAMSDEAKDILFDKEKYSNCCGAEIYEGDILASDPLYDGFQTFSTIEMGWSPVDGNEYGWHWRNGPPVRPVDMVDERYSVIGNIYENPELLEANQ